MPLSFLAGIGFVAVFAAAANTPIASTLMAIELFGSEIGIYAALACVVAWRFLHDIYHMLESCGNYEDLMEINANQL